MSDADRSRRVLVVSGLVGLLALALVLWTVLAGGDDGQGEAGAPASAAGQCVAGPADPAEIDCGEAAATYRVSAEAGDGCDPAEVEGDGVCLDWNAAVGDCFRLGNADQAATKVDCAEGADDPAVQQVDRIGEVGQACANGGLPRVNQARGTLLCLVEPGR